MDNVFEETIEQQKAPKIEKVTLEDIQKEVQEEFTEKVSDAFKLVVEMYQKLSSEEKEQVKEYLKNR